MGEASMRRIAAMVGLEIMNAPSGPGMKTALRDAAVRFESAASMCRGLADGMPEQPAEFPRPAPAPPVVKRDAPAGSSERRAITPQELSRARKLVASGVSVTAAAREIGRPHQTLSRALKRENERNAAAVDPDAPGRPVPAGAASAKPAHE